MAVPKKKTMTEESKKIGSELRAMRLEKGLKGREIAEKLGKGYRPMHIYNIESGNKTVGLAVIQAYALACGFEAKIVFQPLQDSQLSEH